MTKHSTTPKPNLERLLTASETDRRRYWNARRRLEELNAKFEAGRYLSNLEVAARRNAAAIVREMSK